MHFDCSKRKESILAVFSCIQPMFVIWVVTLEKSKRSLRTSLNVALAISVCVLNVSLFMKFERQADLAQKFGRKPTVVLTVKFLIGYRPYNLREGGLTTHYPPSKRHPSIPIILYHYTTRIAASDVGTPLIDPSTTLDSNDVHRTIGLEVLPGFW
jgi:hypothetical protein